MVAVSGHYGWEPITDEAGGYIVTERMRVPGGWLYRTLILPANDASPEMAGAVALVFVPLAQSFPSAHDGQEPH